MFYYHYNPKDDLQLVELSSVSTEETVSYCTLGMSVHLIEMTTLEEVSSPSIILSISLVAINSEESVSIPELSVSNVGVQVIETSSIDAGSFGGINRLYKTPRNSLVIYDYYNTYRFEATNDSTMIQRL